MMRCRQKRIDKFTESLRESETLINEEKCPCPKTPVGLRPVQLNKMIWDVVSARIRKNDKRHQCVLIIIQDITKFQCTGTSFLHFTNLHHSLCQMNACLQLFIILQVIWKKNTTRTTNDHGDRLL